MTPIEHGEDGEMDTPGFAAWKKRRAQRAADDEDYGRFVAAMRGPGGDANGRASTGTPGGEDPAEGVPDGVVYEQYLSVLSGEAGRRRAEENARRERIEREDAIVRHARIAGGGLSRSHEHLRERLEGFGRPHEGS